MLRNVSGDRIRGLHGAGSSALLELVLLSRRLLGLASFDIIVTNYLIRERMTGFQFQHMFERGARRFEGCQ